MSGRRGYFELTELEEAGVVLFVPLPDEEGKITVLFDSDAGPIALGSKEEPRNLATIGYCERNWESEEDIVVICELEAAGKGEGVFAGKNAETMPPPAAMSGKENRRSVSAITGKKRVIIYAHKKILKAYLKHFLGSLLSVCRQSLNKPKGNLFLV